MIEILRNLMQRIYDEKDFVVLEHFMYLYNNLVGSAVEIQ